MTESMTIKIGETRKIKVLIENTRERGFVVSDAKWTLRCGDEVEDSGVCEIQELCGCKTILSGVVTPMRKNAVYTFEILYTIEPETLIYLCELRVC